VKNNKIISLKICLDLIEHKPYKLCMNNQVGDTGSGEPLVYYKIYCVLRVIILIWLQLEIKDGHH